MFVRVRFVIVPAATVDVFQPSQRGGIVMRMTVFLVPVLVIMLVSVLIVLVRMLVIMLVGVLIFMLMRMVVFLMGMLVLMIMLVIMLVSMLIVPARIFAAHRRHLFIAHGNLDAIGCSDVYADWARE